MAGLLIKLFSKNGASSSEAETRSRYGVICGALGIFLNVLLFAAKLVAGLLSGSLAVTADAFNNLSDAGSSIITLAGFRLAAKKPDRDHPFGHGRLEYISGLLVSMLIILMGFELVQSSFDKLSSPEAVTLSALTVVIMLASIGVKLYMSAYNRKYGRIIGSSAMLATATDSLSDALSGAVVLVSGIITHYTGNGYVDIVCGILISLFIIKAGFGAVKDTVSPLLGRPASAEFVHSVEQITLSHSIVLGIHDMVVHDYGPGRVMVSLHAEVSAKENILKIHDVIDNIENELNEKLGCEAVIHMDPIDTEDAKTLELRSKVTELAKQISPLLMIHDFRMVSGETHTNLIFDMVIPPNMELPAEEYSLRLSKAVSEYAPDCRCVIKLDHLYTE